MDGRPKLVDEPAWKKLLDYFNKNGENINIMELFAKDPNRFEKYR